MAGDRIDALTRALGRGFDPAGGGLAIETLATRPWASATFVGERRRLRLAYEGADAVTRATATAAALPEISFTLPGMIVADAVLCSEDAGESLLVELLLIEAA